MVQPPTTDQDRQGEAETLPGPRGDPEMVPVYAQTLLPVFCSTFQGSMVPSVKRAALGLIKKMIHYIDKDLLKSISLTEVAGQ